MKLSFFSLDNNATDVRETRTMILVGRITKKKLLQMHESFYFIEIVSKLAKH